MYLLIVHMPEACWYSSL